MVTEKVVIKNRAGLHARPASLIVQEASRFSCALFLIKEDDTRVNAKSIMNLLTMGASYNTEIMIEADGPDEQEALDSLVALFNRKFEE